MSKSIFELKVKVNLSSTFMARSRCKKCKGLPEFFYHSKLPYYHVSPHSSNLITTFVQNKLKIVSDYYLSDDPSNFNNLSAFSSKSCTAYNARYHISRAPSIYGGSMRIDYLSCKCRSTVWAFKQSTPTEESMSKKARTTYNKKFIF